MLIGAVSSFVLAIMLLISKTKEGKENVPLVESENQKMDFDDSSSINKIVESNSESYTPPNNEDKEKSLELEIQESKSSIK